MFKTTHCVNQNCYSDVETNQPPLVWCTMTFYHLYCLKWDHNEMTLFCTSWFMWDSCYEIMSKTLLYSRLYTVYYPPAPSGPVRLRGRFAINKSLTKSAVTGHQSSVAVCLPVFKYLDRYPFPPTHTIPQGLSACIGCHNMIWTPNSTHMPHWI